MSNYRYVIRSVAGTTAVDEGIAGAEASLFSPVGTETDSAGNVYVADAHRIRRIDVAGAISTFAGTGNRGYGGDGGPAVQARLAYPSDIATDGTGNLYIANLYNHRVRRIDAMGMITTIAGTGQRGYGGDSGPAAEARLSFPRGVALDATGNLYVADTLNYRVRRVDTETGIITTIAGTGERFDSFSYSPVEGGQASQARFTGRFYVATDSAGNIYVSDAFANAVRKIDGETGTITTIAGSPGASQGFGGDGGPAAEARFSTPRGMATDTAGNVYVADYGNHRVRKINSMGTVSTLAGTGERGYGGDGGPASEAQLSYPYDVATDSEGNVYVTDRFNYRVRKIGAGTSVITTLAGTGSPTGGWSGGAAAAARLRFPHSVAVDAAGTLFFADTHHRVWKLDASGLVAALAGTGEPGYSGDGGPATEAQLSDPRGVAVDTAGNVYVADHDNHRLRKIDAMGTVTTLAGTGERGYGGDGGPATEAQLSFPLDVAVDGGGSVYVADRANLRIRKIDATGMITTIAGTGQRGYGGDGGPAAEARFASRYSVATDSAGNVFVADTDNRRVRKIDATSGNIETAFETDGYPPLAVAVDGDGNLYVGGGRQIRVIDANGEASVIAGTGTTGFSGDGQPAGGAELSVSGMAVDRFGAVWFSDPWNHRIRVLEPSPGQN